MAHLLVAASLTSACQPLVELKGRVVVPASLTGTLSEARYGMVVVSGSDRLRFDYLLAVICAPLDEDLTLKFFHRAYDCVEATTVTARLLVRDAAGENPTCEVGQRGGISPDLGSPVAEASAPVFVADNGCGSHHDSVTVTLAPG